MIEGVQDTVRWMGTKNGLFAIKSMYRALQQRTHFSFPWKCIWKNYVQPKTCFLAREAS